MTVRESIFEIALSALYELNFYLYQYWAEKLCDENENLIAENLTDEYLYLIQLDVENQMKAA